MKTTDQIRLENLDILIDEAGGAPTLAKLAGYKQPSYIYQIKNRTAIQNGKPKNIGNIMAKKLELAMNKPDGWMDIDHSSVKNNRESNVGEIGQFILWGESDPLPSDEFVMVPFYKDVEFSAGNGRLAIDDESNSFKLAFARSTLNRYGVCSSSAICVTARGNSMEPVIPNGSTVGIDRNNTRVIDGKLYAIRQDDWLRIKRLYRASPNTIRINSFNIEEFPDEIVNDDELEIIGKVFTWSVMYS